ncbi:MAG: 2Fe-2S iron-sulfur cluster-binding protein [Sphaerochaeta sp.]|nr:2Fe-2S iron-sulfur cluster-binding protein [Sphaerochaeta sp.]MDX9826001.1 2Fe-2S iron-sulfur cluster-binding protein [Sphaerochaeta sp.]
MIEKDSPSTREEIRRQISGNLCRCTGYEHIVDAIEKTQKKRIEQKKG